MLETHADLESNLYCWIFFIVISNGDHCDHHWLKTFKIWHVSVVALTSHHGYDVKTWFLLHYWLQSIVLPIKPVIIPSPCDLSWGCTARGAIWNLSTTWLPRPGIPSVARPLWSGSTWKVVHSGNWQPKNLRLFSPQPIQISIPSPWHIGWVVHHHLTNRGLTLGWGEREWMVQMNLHWRGYGVLVLWPACSLHTIVFQL